MAPQLPALLQEAGPKQPSAICNNFELRIHVLYKLPCQMLRGSACS